MTISIKRILPNVFRAIFGNEQDRYEARHEILDSLAIRNNFRLYNKNLAWITDQEFLKIWGEFPENKSSKIIHERKFNLYNLAKAQRQVVGDLAECGVHRGSSSFLMLAATEGTGKHLFGFDSFEGLSKPKEEDKVDKARLAKWKENDLAIGMNYASSNLERFSGRYSLFKAWIPQRFNEIKDSIFSMVHIDVDLYEPTLDSLDFFYPRLQNGGIIICDDYGSEICPGAKKAMDEFAIQHGTSVTHLTTGQGIIFKNGK
ncbi:MAG: methyltransferase [Chloroflexi bacterium]|nr:MAG: methyltransferase [Chloroflexota bacterium]MBL1193161.1 methyltransferase [Chloroflexota bacterium]NOH10454.1 methyltransferase [Chloroflexota bacterium]